MDTRSARGRRFKVSATMSRSHGEVTEGEVSQIDVAYLTDRVLLAENKKQIYGTQFTYSNGKWEPKPLGDAGNVDKRRAEIGLKPLAEYVKDLQSAYENPPKK